MATSIPDSTQSGSGGVVSTGTSREEEGAHDMRAAAIQERLDDAARKIALLNQQFRDLKRLYNGAVENDKFALYCSYRIQMRVLLEVKSRYYQYACIEAEELHRVQTEIKKAKARPTACSDSPSSGVLE
ncbi:hypothetical protein HPB48_019915 [Haemaphysalis longicornis]|uniref:Uncharacterized protein n=1 Tax=Haemaphysalis longicornis TaxID=44386 RepID=A0A9J6FQD9_HAELO|nr:hypothetical protein HPB48_019915 [Haemaphysalis longicornis]